ncbi:MAG: segregation/condensation protein A [Coriobacteriales bacterium]|nr:segregation/condensation protein A [Coriobacteriales bacterium]
MSYRVKTQAYSGPFDLLLQLVSRQKVDIGQVAIAQVADQYLTEVDAMGELDLDVASDFLLVASTLLEIKAASLVPDDEPRRLNDDDEEDDLAELTPDQAREVLIARLIAYKQFRNAGTALGSRMEAEALMVPRTVGPDPEFYDLMPDYLQGITLRSLAVICADLDSRRESLLLEAEHVAPRRAPIALTVASVDRMTRSHPILTFTELLDGQHAPEVIVATFLAVLELYKRGSIRVTQSHAFGEIDIARVEGAPAFELDDTEITSIEEDA